MTLHRTKGWTRTGMTKIQALIGTPLGFTPPEKPNFRKPLRKQRKGGSALAKRKALDAFSKYIRLRDAIRTMGSHDTALCITCDKEYPCWGVGCLQAGHFIPGRRGSNLFDERNAHAQCYNCNVNLKGNWVKYEAKMIKLYGKEIVEELKELDRIATHYKLHDYEEFERYFREKYEALKQ